MIDRKGEKVLDYNFIRKNYITSKQVTKYKEYQETDTWARFVAWREEKAIIQALEKYKWKPSDKLLDIPCGTGKLAKMLQQFPFQILASDISEGMLAQARKEYSSDHLIDCIKADITNTPFARQTFSCVITLGFLHLVPPEIKSATLKEIAALSSQIAIVSCSVDTTLQRIKQIILPWFKGRYSPAPCPITMEEIIAECQSHGFRVTRAFKVVPFLSAHVLLVLEK